MASPFSLVRKHERLLMAALVLVAMIAFVFMPQFGMPSGRTSAQDPVAAETALYGDIHESDLQRMLMARQLANRFIQQTMAEVSGGFASQESFGPESEASVVDTMLKARKAEQLGMRVTDDEVTRFLQQISSDRLTAEQFGNILQSISGRKGALSKRQLYDALRTELLAWRLARGFSASQQETPAERWESYERLNNRAVIAAIPVAVADFLEKVPDPDEAAVRGLYERYKQFEPTPGAPVPGFKIPAKVALEYFTADYEQFEDEAAVTDKEILDEYEKNKNTRYLKRPDFDDQSKGTDTSDAQTAPASDAEPKPEGNVKESDAPANEPAPDGEQHAPEVQPDGTTTPEAEPKNPTQQSSISPSRERHKISGIELALADISQADNDAPSQAASGESKPTEPKTEDSAPADDVQQAAPQAADETTAEPDKSAQSTDEKADTEGAASESGDANASKYEPLSKVESTIRAALARQKAMKKMQAVLGQLREKMVKYGNDHTRWEVKHERDKTVQKPKPLDFDSLAAEYDVSAHKTGLVTALELREAGGIGESIIGQGTSFLAHAFGQWQFYQAASAIDSAGNQYLVWKTEQQPARVPELSEARDEVVRAWKMIEARKPAAEHAKSLVEAANKDELPLTELATRDSLPVIKPEPFSWLTYGTTLNINNNAPPRLSAVTGIEDAGYEFMQAVFSQPIGGIGIASNNPQTIYYVIQVNEFEPGLATLQRTFLADDYRTYAPVALPHQQQMAMAWNNSIVEEAGLKWVRPPDARRARPDAEGDVDDSGD